MIIIDKPYIFEYSDMMGCMCDIFVRNERKEVLFET